MKYFILSCLSLISLTACHVENGYYYDVPNYSTYHEHGHHGFRRGHHHEHQQVYIPENRHEHGHGGAVVIPDRSRGASSYHGHDAGPVVVPSSRGSASNVHGH